MAEFPDMPLGEASRQYQATLEARRALLTATDGSVQFEAEHQDSSNDLGDAANALFNAWMRER